MNRPPHHEKIHNLVLDIINAESTDAEWVAYNQINDICVTHEGTTLDHPFQWETLGDYTYNDYKKALSFYFKALKLANSLNLNEYIASINLAIAEQYQGLANLEKAWKFASSANVAAQSLQDLALKKEISEILLKINRTI